MQKPSLLNRDLQDDKFLNSLADAFRLQEAVINSVELAIFSTTPDGVITSFNRAAEILFGYASEELIGRSNPLQLFNLDELVTRAEGMRNEIGKPLDPVFDVLVEQVRSKGKPNKSEWSMVRKNGTRFPASMIISNILDEQHELAGYVIIITDLTEEKKKDAIIAASEQKFRLLAENIPGVIYLCRNDPSYSMIYLNDRIYELTGYHAIEFTSQQRSLLSLFHPEDYDSVVQAVNRALKDKRSFDVKFRLKHRNNEWRWIHEVGVGVYNGDKVLMIEGFMSDITLQKQAEEKVEQFAQENLKVFNNSVYLNAIAGYDGYFQRLSPSWSRVLGWSDEELKAKPFASFVHPDDVEATINATKFIVSGNTLQSFENRYRAKDGSYHWLLWGSAADPDNELIYASAIDITERKKSEQQLINSKKDLELLAVKLQEQNRQLDEFAHIISHNLRSPVGNIQALINLLDDNSNMEDFKLIFEKLKNVSKNLGETMNDLMDTLKVKTNTSIERVEIRFKEMLDKVVQSLEGDFITAEASLTYDFNEAPSVNYPKAYLESIFQNLLSNAIKYRAKSRKPLIHLSSKMVDDRVVLAVKDNGLGIDMEKFGHKLFGLHKTFHAHAEAKGVGLFLIKTQVEAMGGSIAAESKVDEGTTFTITF